MMGGDEPFSWGLNGVLTINHTDFMFFFLMGLINLDTEHLFMRYVDIRDK